MGYYLICMQVLLQHHPYRLNSKIIGIKLSPLVSFPELRYESYDQDMVKNSLV